MHVVILFLGRVTLELTNQWAFGRPNPYKIGRLAEVLI